MAALGAVFGQFAPLSGTAVAGGLVLGTEVIIRFGSAPPEDHTRFVCGHVTDEEYVCLIPDHDLWVESLVPDGTDVLGVWVRPADRSVPFLMPTDGAFFHDFRLLLLPLNGMGCYISARRRRMTSESREFWTEPHQLLGRALLWSLLQALSLALLSLQSLVQVEAWLLSPVQWERREQELQLQQQSWLCLRQRYQPCLRPSLLLYLAVLHLPLLVQELQEREPVGRALAGLPPVPG